MSAGSRREYCVLTKNTVKFPRIAFAVSLYVSLLPQFSGHLVNCSIFRMVDGLKSPVPVSKEKCVFKVFSQSMQRCEILKYDWEECTNLNLSTNYNIKLSDLEVKSYQHIQISKYSAFSFKFSHVKWQDLVFKIKHRGKKKSCFLRKLHLFPITHSSSSEVYLACPIFSEKYENQEFDLEYSAQAQSDEESRHLILKMPSLRNIDNSTLPEDWEVFIYIDVTELPKLTVYWQAAPSHLGMTSYVVNLISVETGNAVVPARRFSNPTGDRNMYTVFENSLKGEFYFTVQPEGCKTLCRVSTSPRVNIDTPPIVLMLYKATQQSHVDVVLALTEYLRNVCHIDARIDQNDIPLSASKNPFNWCQETFKSADAVMVITSPQQDAQYEAGIYRDVDREGLRLLAEHFCKSRKRFFSVVLPYCTLEDIPQEATSLQHFVLMEDLDKMLWYINSGSRGLCISKLHFMLWGSIPGGKSELHSKGQKLIDALRTANEIITSNETAQVTARQNLIELENTDLLLSKMEHNDSYIFSELSYEDNKSNNEQFTDSIHAVLSEREHINRMLAEKRETDISFMEEVEVTSYDEIEYILEN
ncbi:uncharacterized protein [Anabrus simplex]|uniref:uncharacterized protein isoform X2 n=1 Tax=Anabrus simplex TaxID=316456 RepID=UPI0035A2C271